MLNVCKELEELCGIERITKLKIFKFNEIQQNLYTKIINDFEKIAYKIQSKFNGNLTISKNSHDDSDFRIEVKFIWPDDLMKNAVKKFENKIEKMKIKFEKEAIVRVTEIVNKDRLERIKKNILRM